MPVTMGLGTIFVLSYLPPTPTSRTVASTCVLYIEWCGRTFDYGTYLKLEESMVGQQGDKPEISWHYGSLRECSLED